MFLHVVHVEMMMWNLTSDRNTFVSPKVQLLINLCWLGSSQLECSELLEDCQPAITAAGDHVANFSPGVQVRVIDLHRVHRHRGREVSAGGPTPDGIQQPIDGGYRHTCSRCRHWGHLDPFLLSIQQNGNVWVKLSLTADSYCHWGVFIKPQQYRFPHFTSSGQYFSTVSSAPSASFQPPTA